VLVDGAHEHFASTLRFGRAEGVLFTSSSRLPKVGYAGDFGIYSDTGSVVHWVLNRPARLCLAMVITLHSNWQTPLRVARWSSTRMLLRSPFKPIICRRRLWGDGGPVSYDIW